MIRKMTLAIACLGLFTGAALADPIEATWKRGNGNVFYFRPGHETYPIYYDDNVKRVLKNAVKWAAQTEARWADDCPNVPADQAPEPITVQGAGLHRPGQEGFK